MNGRQHAVCFFASVFSVLLLPGRPLEIICPVLLRLYVLACLHRTSQVFCYSLFQQHVCQWFKNVSARWDKQRAFLAGDRSTLLRCNPKCFSYHLVSCFRYACGESKVWPICQRYYSIKVYDRRSCMSIFPRSLFSPRIPLHLC
jgi:hypothetical protein